MTFRILFLLTIGVLTLNIDGLLYGDVVVGGNVEVVGIGNSVEKLMFMLTGLAFVLGRRRNWGNIVALGCMVSLTFVCAALSHYMGFQWALYERNLFSLIALMLLLMASPTAEDQAWVMKIIAFAPFVSVLLGVFYGLIGLRSATMVDIVGVTRLQGSYAGPAWLGAMACCALPCAVRLGDRTSRLFLLLVPIDGLILVLTAARSPIAVGATVATACLVLGFRRQFGMKLMAGVVGLAVLTPLLAIFGDNIYRRFTQAGADGRDILWESVGPAMREFADYGVGLGHQPSVLPLDVAREAETFALHNEFMRYTLELGQVGGALFFILFAVILLGTLLRERLEMPGVFLAAIAGFALYCYTDNAFSVPSIFLLIPVAVMVSKPLPPVARHAPAVSPEYPDASYEVY